MPSFNTTVTDLSDNDIEIEVDYRFHPGCRGSRDSLGGIRGAGPPLETDEPAYTEIEDAHRVDNGEQFDLDTLSDKEMKRLEQVVWEHFVDNSQPEPPEPDWPEPPLES